MEIFNFVQQNKVATVLTAGAILASVILTKNYGRIGIKYKDWIATFEKNPTESKIPPTKVENVGNFQEIFEKGQLKQIINCSDNYIVPAETTVINTGNVKNIYKEKVEGGTATYSRTFKFAVNPKIDPEEDPNKKQQN